MKIWLVGSIITALHGMQTQSGDENLVCPSNACIVTKWKKDLSRFLYYTLFARSATAVTPSKKVQLTLIGSPLCAFQ